MSGVNVITALFDIGREKLGDGRSMEQYLVWFGKTLQLKVPMIIYTEEKFKRFVEERRNPENTEIRIQTLEEIPMYKHKESINKILNDPGYFSKIKDNSRIECNLDLYNTIQYSKFGWLQKEIESGSSSDFYFWMDAGCSRFFSDFDLSLDWPNLDKLDDEKFIIQGNINTQRIYPSMDTEEYKWDNNCILVGTLFGGIGSAVSRVSDLVVDILEKEMIELNMINNEQIALAILFKRNPELFNIHIDLAGDHLPLFKHLSN
jgi:hypothetical protein